MDKFLKGFKEEFELYLGSIFLFATSIIVIMNVFTRYFLKFTFTWAEEVAVAAFVWTIFLGFASAYRTNDLIGVEVLMKLVPEKGRNVVEFITSMMVTVLSGIMFFFSYKYVSGSSKITAALEISYKYIYVSMVIAFALITVYSIYYSVRSFKKIFSNQDMKN